MTLRTATVKPKVIDLAVIRQKFCDLGDEIFVVFLGIGERNGMASPLRGRIIESHLESVFAASIRKFTNHIAFTVLPWGIGYAVSRICRLPKREAVVMLTGQNGVRCARLLRHADPLFTVQFLRVKSLRGHFDAVPISVSREK